MSRQASGFKAWLLQRITAVYLGLFSLFLLYHFLFTADVSFEQWKLWVTDVPIMISLLLLLLFTLTHAWIGIRDVMIDYIPHLGTRLVALSLLGLALLVLAFWTLSIFLLASFT